MAPFLTAGVVISAKQLKYLDALRTKTALDLPGDPLDKMIPTRVQVLAAWSNIALASEEKATALLNVVASASYEPQVPQSLIADSKERAAVVSAVYNLGGLAAMPSMKAALEADNRAEAWYELRYNTNAGGSRSKGLAIRRYRESDLFGLYDDGTMSAEESDAEAKETLRMYTKHQTKIDAEEKAFPPTVSSSAAALIAPARNLLIANYVTAKNLGVSIDGSILVGAALANEAKGVYKLDGTGKNDLVLGEGGNNTIDGAAGSDVLYGGNGDDMLDGGADDDVLIGGTGKDSLKGGAGVDKYIYTIGDGDDTIEDADGLGSIIVGDKALAGNTKPSYKDAANHNLQTWDSTDGQFKYVLLNGDLTAGGTLQIKGVGTGGATITINNFKRDQLGLALNPQSKLAFSTSGGNKSPITSGDYTVSGASAAINEFGSKLVKVFLNSAAAAGDKLRLAASGATSAGLQVVDGALTRSLDGGVDIALAAGQTEIVFAIVDKDAVTANQTVTLGATLVQANGGAGASDTLTLTINDNGQAAAGNIQTSRTIAGDGQPIDFDPAADGIQPHYDELGNPLVSGSAGDRDDVLFDSAGNDLIQSGGGKDYISATKGGDDIIDAGSGDDQANGGDGNDRILGGTGHDVLRGQAGNDLLEGGAGPDVLYGQIGDDTLYAESQVALADAIAQGASGEAGIGQGDFLQGMDGTDTVVGSNRADLLGGGAGGDMLVAGQGDDFIAGDMSYDIFGTDWSVGTQVTGTSTTYTINGASGIESEGGDDTIHAGAGNDGVLAGGGDDLVMAEDGNDKVWGEAGGDVLLGGEGDDQLSGDNGLAELDESKHGDDFLDGANGNDKLYGNGGSDSLYGGAGDDMMIGDDAAQAAGGDDFLDGEDGADTMLGVSGNDTMHGGAGDDFIEGDSGDTAIAPQGSDQLFGEDGNDELQGDAGEDYLDGGAGNDTLFGGIGADQLSGGDGNDYLVGGDGDGADLSDADYIDGGKGDDQLFGEGGDDILFAGDGADWVQAGAGNDVASGGQGADVLFGEEGDDVLTGDAGADQLNGGLGNDIISGGDDDDILFGEAGNDSLAGAAGDDQLVGGDGDDVLDGGDGNNTLYGDAGDDDLRGGPGSDRFIGGVGNDTMSGGGGNDTYYYNLGDGVDRITDSGGVDWLVLGGGITLASVALDVGSLQLKFADGGSLHLDDFDPDNPLDGAIDYIQFSDGQVMSRQQLIQALGFKIEGTPGEDALRGTGLDDVIRAYQSDDGVFAGAGNDTVDLGAGDDHADGGDGNDTVAGGDGSDQELGGNGDDLLDGGGGNDLLFGETGADHLLGGLDDDVLAGGAGTDTLEGGAGNDLYQFGVGDGQDVVIDVQGTDAVQFTGGLTAAEVRFTRDGQNLVIAIVATTDTLTIRNWFDPAGSGWMIAAGDGVLDRSAVEARLAHNLAPLLAADTASVGADAAAPVFGNVLANDSDPEGHALRVTTTGTWRGMYGSFTLSSNGAFNYALNTANANVRALNDGQQLTDTFGYEASDDDPMGALRASSTVAFTIQGTNDAPLVQEDWNGTYEDSPSAVTGDVFYNDYDVDAGTVLSVRQPGVFQGAYGTLTLGADGKYQYDVANQLAVVQSLADGQHLVDEFAYTVTDGTADVATTLQIGVFGSNDLPIVVKPAPDQTIAPGANYQWQIPAGSYVDIDQGDTLRVTASAGGGWLPAWLTFDAETLTFSGLVPADAAGSLEISLELEDDHEDMDATYDSFTLTFAADPGGSDGGKGKGNEGVGNGEDAPPPGHDTNQNDGPGTSPGHPGSKGGTPGKPKSTAAIEPISVAHTKSAASPVHGKSDQAHDARQQKAASLAADDFGAEGHTPGKPVPTVGKGNGNGAAKRIAAILSDMSDTPADTQPIAAQAASAPDKHFGALASYLAQRPAGNAAAPDAAQTALQWDKLKGLSGRLGQDDDDAKQGAQTSGSGSGTGLADVALWGYAGSVGKTRAGGGMAQFTGLSEGFNKLG